MQLLVQCHDFLIENDNIHVVTSYAKIVGIYIYVIIYIYILIIRYNNEFSEIFNYWDDMIPVWNDLNLFLLEDWMKTSCAWRETDNLFVWIRKSLFAYLRDRILASVIIGYIPVLNASLISSFCFGSYYELRLLHFTFILLDTNYLLYNFGWKYNTKNVQTWLFFNDSLVIRRI